MTGLLAVGILSPSLAIAQGTSGSVESLQQQQQQLDQKRSTIQEERDRIQTLEGQAKDELSTLEDNIQATSDQVADTETRLAAAQTQLQDLQQKLARSEQAYQEHQFSTVARLRFLQRQTIGQGWAVLLQSSNFNEFLGRQQQLTLLYANDREILAGLAEEAEAIDQARRRVEQQKNDIALLRQRLLLQKSEYEAQADVQADLVVRLQQDSKALEEAESRLAQDSENLAALIRQRIAAGQGLVLGSGQMVFPAGGRITSRFGWRVHPILGSRRFHSGIDFGASSGTPIRAADAGRVLFSGWYGGYGRAVIVNHGNGVTTLYGHASQIYVSEGDVVQQGQVVAAVGSTGLSTGPHLHFEVHRDGSPVNPASYL
ncbi:MAG: peptidoglycan DD-metalloendopeptidase family protein [Elainellaceae cyanobacterium]